MQLLLLLLIMVMWLGGFQGALNQCPAPGTHVPNEMVEPEACGGKDFGIKFSDGHCAIWIYLKLGIQAAEVKI